ncbi:hypothetical protein B0H67DRAFT_685958 [Lasiosphaeris hirsuta]|uniref:Actin-like ATPase domain-containing protein n=1 Tax=Lasiosphaeris hirsuta TaxID=260670 RepID=A0AA40A271_9PEZI|nr:hypothetical protein B0H67DRAFT_685958 [Lasiosphaeris hirsuta]
MDVAEIIIGIDFGTTYSGVSWAVNAGTKSVHLITDWPDPKGIRKNYNSDKTPTLISYENGAPNKWGFQADSSEARRWFKLLLDPDHKYAKELVEMAEQHKEGEDGLNSAEDATANFLRELWFFSLDEIQERIPGGRSEDYSIKVILAVPAIWGQAAKENIKRLARQAGISEEIPISIVSEPEAAALAVIHDKTMAGERLEKGDIFVVCDAGGGTVDVISYKVNTSDPYPLKVDECAQGDGGLCGSAFLDIGFENWVKTKVGVEEYAQIGDESKAEMMRQFDNQVKRPYSGDKIPRIRSVELKGVKDKPEENIRDDTIYITGTALLTIFDHVCGQVVRLVESQIDEVESEDRQQVKVCVHRPMLNWQHRVAELTLIKSVLLVGGFGANKYLCRRLNDAMEARNSGIRVVQAERAWSSICRGATLWGLEHSARQREKGIQPTVGSRRARCSYGVRVEIPVDEKENKLKQDVDSDDSSSYNAARYQMIWLIEKGDRIQEGRRVHRSISERVELKWYHHLSISEQFFSHSLWYCQRDTPPTRFDDHTVFELCTLPISIRKAKLIRHAKGNGTKGNMRDVEFTLAVEMGSASLDFFVIYDKKKVERCVAEYR